MQKINYWINIKILWVITDRFIISIILMRYGLIGKSLTLPGTDASQAPVNIDLNSSSKDEGSNQAAETASPKPSATPTLLQETAK